MSKALLEFTWAWFCKAHFGPCILGLLALVPIFKKLRDECYRCYIPLSKATLDIAGAVLTYALFAGWNM